MPSTAATIAKRTARRSNREDDECERRIRVRDCDERLVEGEAVVSVVRARSRATEGTADRLCRRGQRFLKTHQRAGCRCRKFSFACDAARGRVGVLRNQGARPCSWKSRLAASLRSSTSCRRMVGYLRFATPALAEAVALSKRLLDQLLEVPVAEVGARR